MAHDVNHRPMASDLLGGYFGLSIGNMFATLGNWNDKRITRRELEQLSDRELDDIGLSRHDIDRAVENLR